MAEVEPTIEYYTPEEEADFDRRTDQAVHGVIEVLEAQGLLLIPSHRREDVIEQLGDPIEEAFAVKEFREHESEEGA